MAYSPEWRRTVARGLVASVVLATGLLAAGQARADGPGADWLWGGGFHAGVPTGSFDAAVGEGWGAAGHLVVLPHERPFGLRLEVSALVYDSRSFTVPAPGTGGYVGDTVRTDSWFGNLLAGPEIRARHGALRPYAHVLAGVGYFATTSERSAFYEMVPLNGTTNFEDTTFAWAVGGGFEIAVGRDVSIDLGVRYLANGSVDYLTQDSIAGDASGALQPHHGEAHVVTFTVGIAFGR
jgi:opacity protein-like surface antigen